MKTRTSRTLTLVATLLFLAIPCGADSQAAAYGDFLTSAAPLSAQGTKIPERY